MFFWGKKMCFLGIMILISSHGVKGDDGFGAVTFCIDSTRSFTPPKFNMEPGNDGFQ